MNSQQCKKVGDVVYMTNWYYLPDKAILDLRLIITRSSVVIKMTAGKLIHMSVYTFGDVSMVTVHVNTHSMLLIESMGLRTIPGDEDRFRIFKFTAPNDVTQTRK